MIVAVWFRLSKSDTAGRDVGDTLKEMAVPADLEMRLGPGDGLSLGSGGS